LFESFIRPGRKKTQNEFHGLTDSSLVESPQERRACAMIRLSRPCEIATVRSDDLSIQRHCTHDLFLQKEVDAFEGPMSKYGCLIHYSSVLQQIQFVCQIFDQLLFDRSKALIGVADIENQRIYPQMPSRFMCKGIDNQADGDGELAQIIVRQLWSHLLLCCAR
jgi:hypothetical protein